MSEGNSSKNNTSPTESPEKSHLEPNNDSSEGKDSGESSSMVSSRTPESNKEKLPAEEGVVVMDEVSDSPKVVAKGEGLTSKSAAEAVTKGGSKRGQRLRKKLDLFFDISCYAGSGSKKTSTSNTEQAAEEHVILEDESMFPTLSRSVEIGAYKTKLCQFWQRNETCPNGDECRFAHGEQELRGLRPVPSSDGDKNTQESQNNASPSESHNDASPAKSQSDASPSKSQNDASPSMSQNDASPAKSQNDASPSKSQNDASSAKSQNDASPSKFRHGEQELSPVPSPVQDRNIQEMSKSNSSPLSSAIRTPSSIPAKSQNDASPSKLQMSEPFSYFANPDYFKSMFTKETTPGMPQYNPSRAMSQNDAPPAMSKNFVEWNPWTSTTVFTLETLAAAEREAADYFAHGDQEVRDLDRNMQELQMSKSQFDLISSIHRPMETVSPSAGPAANLNLNYASPAVYQDTNIQELQMSKSNSGPLSSAHSTPCSILSRGIIETPSPSARPPPTMKLNYASAAKSQNYASPSKFALGDQELHSVPRPDLDRNMQELNLSKSAFNFFYKPMETASPSAGPAANLNLNYASPAKSQNNASPERCVTCQRYEPELCFTCRKSKQCLGCHFKEYFPCSTYHAPNGGPPPAFKLVYGSLAKSQKDASPAMSQNIASPAMSQNNASPKLCLSCQQYESEQCLTCHLSEQCITCHFSSGKPCLTCQVPNCRLCNKRSW